MGNSRGLNSKRNIISGLIQQIIGIVIPFANRTAVLWILGAEYQGLSSLFNSILSVLSMAEMGLSSAIVYSMYAPIAEKNTEKVNSLLNFFRKAYLIIGTVIVTLGLLIMPFLPKLVNGNIPVDINIYALYGLYLANTVSSYFFFAYRSTILNAYQRSDISNNVHSIIKACSGLTQFTLLLFFRNYYAYILTVPLFTTASNLIIAWAARKKYPQHEPEGILDKETKKDLTRQVSGLMINKIGDVARNSFDSIIISSMLGLVMVAIYSNYYFVFSSLYQVMLIIINSMGASVGNSIERETQKKNYDDFNRLSFLFAWLTGWFSICMMCLYQPFMKFWVGDKLLLSNGDMMLMCLYFYLINANNVRNVYFAGNGLWWRAKHLFIFEAVGNLILNFGLGYWFGIKGVILATIITILVFNFYMRSKLLFNHYFTDYKISEFWKKHIVFLTVSLVNASVCYWISSYIKIGGIVGLLICGILCAVIPNIVYLLLYYRWKLFKESVKWTLKILKAR